MTQRVACVILIDTADQQIYTDAVMRAQSPLLSAVRSLLKPLAVRLWIAIPIILIANSTAFGSCGDWLAHGTDDMQAAVLSDTVFSDPLEPVGPHPAAPQPCSGPQCKGVPYQPAAPLQTWKVVEAPKSVGCLCQCRQPEPRESRLLFVDPHADPLPGSVDRIDRPPQTV